VSEGCIYEYTRSHLTRFDTGRSLSRASRGEAQLEFGVCRQHNEYVKQHQQVTRARVCRCRCAGTVRASPNQACCARSFQSASGLMRASKLALQSAASVFHDRNPGAARPTCSMRTRKGAHVRINAATSHRHLHARTCTSEDARTHQQRARAETDVCLRVRAISQTDACTNGGQRATHVCLVWRWRIATAWTGVTRDPPTHARTHAHTHTHTYVKLENVIGTHPGFRTVSFVPCLVGAKVFSQHRQYPRWCATAQSGRVCRASNGR
jgi:hypothetical protein